MSFPNVPKRYFVIFLLFICNLMEGYVLTSMGIMIVETEAEFGRTSIEQGLLLGVNYVGQIFACVSGIVVHKIGGATYLGIGMLGEAILFLISPVLIRFHVLAIMADRFILGLFEGLSFVGWADVLVHWAPPGERVRLFTYASLGMGLGVASNYPISGFMVQNFGWPSLFYIPGIVGLVWSTVWFIFVSNDPTTDRFISEKERKYLMQEIKHIPKNEVVVPYKKILTSLPVYLLLNEFFVSSIINSFMMLLPLYVKDVHNASIQVVGLISGIPEISSLVTRPLFAYLADYLRSKTNGLSTGQMHKLFLFWGQASVVLLFLVSSFWDSIVVCIVCFTLARITFNFCQVSYNVIVNDMAGIYAGFLNSIVVVIKSAAYFINPLIIGFMVHNHSQSEWNTYFLMISLVTSLKIITFIIFGSGDLQPWAMISSEKDSRTNNDDSVRKDKIIPHESKIGTSSV